MQLQVLSDLAITQVPAAVTGIDVLSYATAGDLLGFPMQFARVGSAPATFYVQSADGAIWQLVNRVITPEMFGAQGNGTHDDTPAIQAMFNQALNPTTLTAQSELYFPASNYYAPTGPVTANCTGVAISGGGQFTTTITNPNGTGIFKFTSFAYSSIGKMQLKGAGGVPNRFSLNYNVTPNVPYTYNATLTANAGPSPDGTNDAFLLANNSLTAQSSGILDYGNGSTISVRVPNVNNLALPLLLNQTYTIKAWVKPGASNYIQLAYVQNFGITGTWVSVTVNAATGALGEAESGTGATYLGFQSQAAAGGYWVEMSFEITGGVGASLGAVSFNLISALTGNSYASNNGYIPVTAAANALSVYIYSPALIEGSNSNLALPTDVLINLVGGAGFNTQTSRFYDLAFEDCYDGMATGAVQADTSTIINPYFNSCSHAGFATYNYNALAWTILGGNAEANLMGVFVEAGSVPNINGLNTELNTCDFVYFNTVGDGMRIGGLRSESQAICYAKTGCLHLDAIHHSPPSPVATDVLFWNDGQEPAILSNCTNFSGQVKMGGGGEVVACSWATGWTESVVFQGNNSFPTTIRNSWFNGIPELGGGGTYVGLGYSVAGAIYTPTNLTVTATGTLANPGNYLVTTAGITLTLPAGVPGNIPGDPLWSVMDGTANPSPNITINAAGSPGTISGGSSVLLNNPGWTLSFTPFMGGNAWQQK